MEIGLSGFHSRLIFKRVIIEELVVCQQLIDEQTSLAAKGLFIMKNRCVITHFTTMKACLLNRALSLQGHHLRNCRYSSHPELSTGLNENCAKCIRRNFKSFMYLFFIVLPYILKPIPQAFGIPNIEKRLCSFSILEINIERRWLIVQDNYYSITETQIAMLHTRPEAKCCSCNTFYESCLYKNGLV